MNNKQLVAVIVVAFVAIFTLSLALNEWLGEKDEAAQRELVLEEQKDYFVDIDGDGDLDYVHFVQFIRQENEEADPYPAPIQPGQ